MVVLMTILVIAMTAVAGAGWVALTIRNRRQEEEFRRHGRM